MGSATAEAYIGGRHLTERAAELLHGFPAGASVGDLVQRAQQTGEAAATALLDEAATAAALITANLTTLLNPRAIVMGGGVLEGWPQLFDRIATALPEFCHAPVRDHLVLLRSRLGGDALLIGAASLVHRPQTRER
jgi:glucokinase